jgi:plastocyanin
MSPEKNLVIQLLMGAALIVGMFLARQKKFTAHGVCQSVVVLLNLIPIFYFMAPVFHHGVQPRLFHNLTRPFYLTSGLHALVGTIAELFALYILLVGWKVLPASLRFENYKKFMRIGLCLWWLTIVLGLATYYVWYLKPASTTTMRTTTQTTDTNTSVQNNPKEVVVELTKENQFIPKELKIEVGTTVIWKNLSGHHNVISDDSGFESPELDAGGEFKRTFDKEGTYKYFCAFHGGPNGERMSGVIIVTPKQK